MNYRQLQLRLDSFITRARSINANFETQHSQSFYKTRKSLIDALEIPNVERKTFGKRAFKRLTQKIERPSTTNSVRRKKRRKEKIVVPSLDLDKMGTKKRKNSNPDPLTESIIITKQTPTPRRLKSYTARSRLQSSPSTDMVQTDDRTLTSQRSIDVFRKENADMKSDLSQLDMEKLKLIPLADVHPSRRSSFSGELNEVLSSHRALPSTESGMLITPVTVKTDNRTRDLKDHDFLLDSPLVVNRIVKSPGLTNEGDTIVEVPKTPSRLKRVNSAPSIKVLHRDSIGTPSQHAKTARIRKTQPETPVRMVKPISFTDFIVTLKLAIPTDQVYVECLEIGENEDNCIQLHDVTISSSGILLIANNPKICIPLLLQISESPKALKGKECYVKIFLSDGSVHQHDFFFKERNMSLKRSFCIKPPRMTVKRPDTAPIKNTNSMIIGKKASMSQRDKRPKTVTRQRKPIHMKTPRQLVREKGPLSYQRTYSPQTLKASQTPVTPINPSSTPKKSPLFSLTKDTQKRVLFGLS
ncbi:hypothetical protein PCE1_002167 [Barthelona sp. PCE]